MENPNEIHDCKECYWFCKCIKIWNHNTKEVILERGCYLLNGNYMINDRKCYRCHFITIKRGNIIGLFNDSKRDFTILSYIHDEEGCIHDKPN
jgi:hypothetical protein